MVPAATARLYNQQQRRLALLSAALRREWFRMGDDLDSSWQIVGPRVVSLVTAAQFGAAQDGAAAPAATAVDLGWKISDAARVVPASFAGVASDGRGLGSLLYGSVVAARTASVDSLAERLAVGGEWLDMAAQTQVADAARQASGVSIASTPDYYGWQRVVQGPCCRRCAVLAGKFFRWNQGFKRHPRCRCIHVAVHEGAPHGYTANIGVKDIRDITRAQRFAIENGADMNQVLNARRRRSSDRMTTLEGSARRGWASHARRSLEPGGQRAQPRLTPEAIYKFYGDDRAGAVRALAKNGYIVAEQATVARLSAA